MKLNPVDLAVIALYFVLVVGAGVWFQRRAARGLDAYFLGGKNIPWLALSVSGASSMFDVTGTMWIVTLIVLFGFKSMWNHWMWGFLMGAFFMSFMGKWVRRSGVLTGAEWMTTRFGEGTGGRTARTAYALMAVVTLAALLGYCFIGIGKFVSVYISWNPYVCAVAIYAGTTLYVLLGGLYSVVVTDLIQTTILTVASIIIACVAYARVTPETLSTLDSTRPAFHSVLPVWQLDGVERATVRNYPAISRAATLASGASISQAISRNAGVVGPMDLLAAWYGRQLQDLLARKTGYEVYQFFGLLVIAWVFKGLLLNLGGPAQMSDFQRFLAAKNARDAAKVGAAWSVFMIVRWALAVGLALLAIQASTQLSGSPAEDAEQSMPLALADMPMGLRGVVIAGLLSAFMASFSAMVNAGASYVVRDFWQPLVAPRASERHLVWASYAASLSVVVAGVVIGLSAGSIGGVFNWIMMALGAAFAVPNVLRWYWWRTNGWGYAIGTFVGLLAAGIFPFLKATEAPYLSFPIICVLSLVGTIAGTLATQPTDRSLLVSFYRNIRPFGAWGPVSHQADLSDAERRAPSESVTLAIINTILGGVAILGAYLAPMYLVSHQHGPALAWTCTAVAAVVILYFTWYRTLPPAEPGSDSQKPLAA
jgi:Na+/proline symporter